MRFRSFLVLALLAGIWPLSADPAGKPSLVVLHHTQERAEIIATGLARERDALGLSARQVPIVAMGAADLRGGELARLGFATDSFPCVAVVQVSRNLDLVKVLGDPPVLLRDFVDEPGGHRRALEAFCLTQGIELTAGPGVSPIYQPAALFVFGRSESEANRLGELLASYRDVSGLDRWQAAIIVMYPEALTSKDRSRLSNPPCVGIVRLDDDGDLVNTEIAREVSQGREYELARWLIVEWKRFRGLP